MTLNVFCFSPSQDSGRMAGSTEKAVDKSLKAIQGIGLTWILIQLPSYCN